MFTIPKTGTRSIKHLLLNEKHLGFENYKDHICFVPKFADSFFKFTVVRNPFDRIYSLYNSTVITKKIPTIRNLLLDLYGSYTFDTFLNWNIENMEKFKFLDNGYLKTFKPQSSYLSSGIDKIIKFENFETEIHNLTFISKGLEIPKLNTTVSKTDKPIPKLIDLINSNIKKKIILLCEDEFDILGYSKDYS